MARSEGRGARAQRALGASARRSAGLRPSPTPRGSFRPLSVRGPCRPLPLLPALPPAPPSRSSDLAGPASDSVSAPVPAPHPLHLASVLAVRGLGPPQLLSPPPSLHSLTQFLIHCFHSSPFPLASASLTAKPL